MKKIKWPTCTDFTPYGGNASDFSLIFSNSWVKLPHFVNDNLEMFYGHASGTVSTAGSRKNSVWQKYLKNNFSALNEDLNISWHNHLDEK